jgi:hypothetical protein
MKLLKEFYTGSDTEVLVEKSETGAKNYYIKGVFMQAEAQNRNGRVYPRPILENELNRYQQLISEKRSLGELGHPDTPTINLVITSMVKRRFFQHPMVKLPRVLSMRVSN